MSTRKDFSQVAFDVVRQATREEPTPAPKPTKAAPKPQKQTAPKGTKGAAKKAPKKAATSR
jgi:hypothetical protein